MIKKSILLLWAALTVLPSAVSADDDGLIIHLANGGKNSFIFSEMKKIVFDSNNLIIVNIFGSESNTYLFDDIRKITFSDTVTGIESTSVTGSSELDIRLAADGSRIFVGGAAGSIDKPVRLFSVAGTMVMAGSLKDGSIDISALPQGIYILSVENQTFKFKK